MSIWEAFGMGRYKGFSREAGLLLDEAVELAEALGNEIRAVILQALLCGLLGAGFAASSVIWELESWSVEKNMGSVF